MNSRNRTAVAMSFVFTIAASGAARAETLQQLSDRAEIQNLISAVVFAYDRQDVSAFVGYFTGDGSLETVASQLHPDAGIVYRGKDVGIFVTKNQRPATPGAPVSAPSLPSASPSHHAVSNQYIKFTGATTAKHYAYWQIAGGGRPASDGAAPAAPAGGLPAGAAPAAPAAMTPANIRIIAQGAYEDDLVKTSGQWRIKHRKIHYSAVIPN